MVGIMNRQAELTAQPPQPRPVWIIADSTPDPWAVIGGEWGSNPIMNTHMSVHIGGNAQDGPLRVTLNERNGEIGVSATDWGTNHSTYPIGLDAHAQRIRNLLEVGQTVSTNAQLVDGATGKGGILDAMIQDTVYKTGANGCNQFAAALLKTMKIPVPPAVQRLIQASVPYLAAVGAVEKVVDGIPLRYSRMTEWGSSIYPTSEWNVKDPKNPEAKIVNINVDVSGDLEDEARVLPKNENPKPIAQPHQEYARFPDPFKPKDIARTNPNSKAGTYMFARSNGVKSLVSMTAQKIAQTVGIAGLAAGPVFIVLDFVNGHWLGGALAAVGLAIGIAETIFLSTGPVGWVLDIFVTAFFAILPGLFHKKHDPKSNNATEIIQWAMFGDATHTGNEKCRDGDGDVPGQPDCIAVYGPGVIASTFHWEMYDAILFMINFNEGLTMSIPDMAAAFTIFQQPAYGPDKPLPPELVAAIQCQPSIMGSGINADVNEEICFHSKFTLNRTLINLPNLNQNGDQVYERLITPECMNDCDCKINDAALSGMYFPDYNYTLLNSPVSIACNISASLNISGNAVAVGSFDSAIVPTVVSPGNASTDGDAGHAVSPPLPVPFQPMFNSTNSLCLSGPLGSVCLPNGTFDPQTGRFGCDTTRTNAVTIPPAGGSLTVYITEGLPGGPKKTHSNTWSESIPADANEGFGMAMDQISKEDGMSWGWMDVIVPDPGLPGVCVYSDKEYKGDVACFGPGGGDLPSNVQNATQSIMLYGGVSAWVYTQDYGDSGGQRLTVNMPDLSEVTYGKGDSNFANDIVSMWIVVPTAADDSAATEEAT
ncbi:hypothetical protein MMC24_007380 [Lignoscripta atroalba]|nr:hypothetical protein [Lignoscripta atroalba]